MSFDALASLGRSVDIGSQRIIVVEDHHLLQWAHRCGMTPRQAQIASLRAGLLPARYLKNLSILTLHDQRKLAEAAAVILGCGGLGGTIAQLLARTGVGRIRLVDPDDFEPSNLNRQWFATTVSLGRSKARVASESILDINPLTETDPHSDTLDPRSAPALLSGMDVALDALDNIESRFTLAAQAQRQEIPLIHGAVAGWWGQISTILPSTLHGLEAIYGTHRKRHSAETELGVLGPTAAWIAAAQAMEAIRILLGRTPAYANVLAYFDGETGSLTRIPLDQ